MLIKNARLLIKHLCMMQAYSSFCDRLGQVRKLVGVNPIKYEVSISDGEHVPNTYCLLNDDEIVMPYLRPMSSMTEEEMEKYQNLKNQFVCGVHGTDGWRYVVDIDEDSFDIIDWLLRHGLDFRDLIGKGLALEMPQDMVEIVLNLAKTEESNG